jgi:hypothetical protein
MSLNSWKKEFYPVPAKKVKGRIERIKHSWKKWQGALPENCAKHGVQYAGHAVGTLDFNANTCALCCKYYEFDEEHWLNLVCRKCPIVKVTGSTCIEAYDNAFNNPEPMVRLLQEVLIVELEK